MEEYINYDRQMIMIFDFFRKEGYLQYFSVPHKIRQAFEIEAMLISDWVADTYNIDIEICRNGLNEYRVELWKWESETMGKIINSIILAEAKFDSKHQARKEALSEIIEYIKDEQAKIQDT